MVTEVSLPVSFCPEVERIRPFTDADLSAFEDILRGSAFTSDHDDYQAAIANWALGVTHSPAIVVLPESADDVVNAVNFAREHGLNIAVQATGHGVSVACDGGMLINTSRMQGVVIDAVNRTARVEAGAKWAPVVAAAQDYGLAPLNGSTTDVGVVGYTLGGGTGWMARKFGFAADHVISIDVVTAKGEQLHVTKQSYPDLFWAMRGAGGNFGVVTAIEFSLFPVSEVFGGAVFYPMRDAPCVFRAFAAWTETLPDEITASVSLLRLPPLPELPPMLRGQEVAVVRACAIGDLEAAEAIIAPMRGLGTPIFDTFGVMSYRAIDAISMDPLDPMPARSTTLTLDELGEEAIDAILKTAGADTGSPIVMLEARYIRGAINRSMRSGSVANRHDVSFTVFACGIAFDPGSREFIDASLSRLHAAVAPVASDRIFLNFLHDNDRGEERTRAAFAPGDFAWLRRIKADYDPENRFRYNRNIEPELSTRW